MIPSIFAAPRRFPAPREMPQPTYSCRINAEPIARYRPGGYHPICLGDTFKDGRYKILHKLGYGGFATVWAARDRSRQEYVALKVSAAEIHERSYELEVLSALAALNSKEPGARHIVQLVDHFLIQGPNGTHDCVVLEFLGPSVMDNNFLRLNNGRLPGQLAKSCIQQAFLALAHLHKHNIAHGDLHTHNLAFVVPSLHTLTEDEFIEKLGLPQIGFVARRDGRPLEPNLPPYLVQTTSYPAEVSLTRHQQIKLVDFGESFFTANAPSKVSTPLCLRPPEAFFGDRLDHRVDLWSAGCMVRSFELVVGKPPMNAFLTSRRSIVRQMLKTASDDLPQRWHWKWEFMDETWKGQRTENTFMEHLDDLYYDGKRNTDLMPVDVDKLGALVHRLLRFEPATRASALEILQDDWFVETRREPATKAPVQGFLQPEWFVETRT
ncbi:kinase-like protein [Melanomma pulvis-pyrius CBS 109.77]|uniref:Kinase-like protein n=1 Tax=Melanomma pulvis-pyrius CBS 109.77 TaxID=1314802 RepID=A0A6A6WY66_9PLEO|nr:kinase-like protein [Melanomma pulvis-pyrius CBS 109.77]